MVQMAKSPLVDRYDLSGLQMVNSGAAITKREVEVEFKRRLNNPKITQGT